MTAEDLARLALETLEAQRAFFKSRLPADLDAAKGLERRLYKAALHVLSDPGQGRLFDDGGND